MSRSRRDLVCRGSFLSALVAAVLLAACGPASTPSPTISPTLADTSSSETPTAAATATPVGSLAIAGIGVAIGREHACALAGDGTIKCWGVAGANYWGQLGDGTTTDSAIPVTVVADAAGGSALSAVTAVAAGPAHTCALLADTTVKCWGDNEVHPTEPLHYGDQGGQLGNGTMISSLTPVTVIAATGSDSPLSGVTAVSAGHFSTCALLAVGTVTCWGAGETAPAPVAAAGPDSDPLAGAIAISSGKYHTCALLADTTVKCWGDNSSGQLGDGSATNSSTPVAVVAADGSGVLSGVAAIAAGGGFGGDSLGGHTCALLEHGTVMCWGNNDFGQIGTGTAGEPGSVGQMVTTPATVVAAAGSTSLLSEVAAISAGPSNSCALLLDTTVACWGGAPTTVIGTDGTGALLGVRAVVAGGFAKCAVMADGEIVCWAGDEAPVPVPGFPIGGTAPSPEATSAVPMPDPQAVVQAFYDWYLTDLEIDHLLARPDLTPGFVEWLMAFDWGYNPIVCGNGLPGWIQAESAEISGSSATVPTTVFFSGSTGQPGPPVELTLGPTGWQISAVDCGL